MHNQDFVNNYENERQIARRLNDPTETDDEYVVCEWCAGDGCKACGFTGHAPDAEETLDDIANLAQALTLYDEGELSHEELIRLFQHLVDTGLAWSLQGSIGRLAVDLIEAGLVTR